MKGRRVQKGASGAGRPLGAWKRACAALGVSLAAHGWWLGSWGRDVSKVPWGMKTEASNPSRVPQRFRGHARPAERPLHVVTSRLVLEQHAEPGREPSGLGSAPAALGPAQGGVSARSQPEGQAPPLGTTAPKPAPQPAAEPTAEPTAAPPAPVDRMRDAAADVSTTTAPYTPPGAAPQGLQRPAWPTRIPADFIQTLNVSRGSQTGQGQWSWSVTGGRYRSELKAQLDDPRATRRLPVHPGEAAPSTAAPVLHWSSSGGLDAYGVAPERFLTQPVKGGARAVNFQRDTGRVSYSGPTGQAALVPGAQDRLSWLVQLLALAQAHPEGRGLPAELPLWVAGPQGDGGDWRFAVEWNPATSCWEFTRRAERRYDVQVQAWVAVGSTAQLIRLEMGPEGGRQAPWLLRDAARPQACGHPP